MPWVHAKDGAVPPRAQEGGKTANLEPIYIARAYHEGALIPGKLMVSMGCAIISWGGTEFKKKEYEVLVDGPAKWKPIKDNKLPIYAYPGGWSENHVALFIGRADYMGSVIPGKVEPMEIALFIILDGKEHMFVDGFSVLCH